MLGTVGLLRRVSARRCSSARWVAITEVIPYLGPWLGAIPPFLYALVVASGLGHVGGAALPRDPPDRGAHRRAEGDGQRAPAESAAGHLRPRSRAPRSTGCPAPSSRCRCSRSCRALWEYFADRIAASSRGRVTSRLRGRCPWRSRSPTSRRRAQRPRHSTLLAARAACSRALRPPSGAPPTDLELVERARWSRSSGRTAPASRRCSRSSPARCAERRRRRAPRRARRLGPQRPAHYGRLTARENLAAVRARSSAPARTGPTRCFASSSCRADVRARRAVASATVSGSTSRSRCSARPHVLLLDEPTASLDPGAARAPLGDRPRTCASAAAAVLVATHHWEELRGTPTARSSSSRGGSAEGRRCSCSARTCGAPTHAGSARRAARLSAHDRGAGRAGGRLLELEAARRVRRPRRPARAARRGSPHVRRPEDDRRRRAERRSRPALGRARRSVELADGKVVAVITVPPGFVSTLKQMVKSPTLELGVTRGGTSGRVRQQVQALVYPLNRKLQRAYIDANLAYVQADPARRRRRVPRRNFKVLGLDSTAKELREAAAVGPGQRRSRASSTTRGSHSPRPTTRCARPPSPSSSSRSPSAAAPRLVSAQVQSYAFALTITFLALVLAAGALAARARRERARPAGAGTRRPGRTRRREGRRSPRSLRTILGLGVALGFALVIRSVMSPAASPGGGCRCSRRRPRADRRALGGLGALVGGAGAGGPHGLARRGPASCCRSSSSG